MADDDGMIDRGRFDALGTGTIAFDRQRTNVLDSPLVVMDGNAGTLGEHESDGDKYRSIKYNDTNQQLRPGENKPLEDGEPLVDAVFVDANEDAVQLDDQTYTFPAFRLEPITPDKWSPIEVEPYVLAKAELFGDLARAIEEDGMEVDDRESLKVLAMKAGVEGRVFAEGVQNETDR